MLTEIHEGQQKVLRNLHHYFQLCLSVIQSLSVAVQVSNRIVVVDAQKVPQHQKFNNKSYDMVLAVERLRVDDVVRSAEN